MAWMLEGRILCDTSGPSILLENVIRRVRIAGEDAVAWIAGCGPGGRIDVIWNDTRNTGQANLSELYYAYSNDGELTRSANEPVSPVFDSHVGWPNQHKLGDYYHTVSDDLGVNVAYAATFNGEQDVYFLHIGAYDCNRNGVPDEYDITGDTSEDCNGDLVPDECQSDCNGNDIADPCDIADGTSEDCNDDLVPDDCQPDRDCNSNGFRDICDIGADTSSDCNRNLGCV